ncbi:hypothetical protein [Streptomyces sp. NPDC059003]|uniref:hypothetical protein n=1 Tax=Streptomyces sp. NPDC059003 TaxID=3346691 RepID=UPI0036A57140
MHLPCAVVTHHVVRAADLDQLVARLAGRPYTATPTADKVLEVDGNLSDAAATRRWMATGGPAPQPQALLNAFAHQGLIDMDEYLIKP